MATRSRVLTRPEQIAAGAVEVAAQAKQSLLILSHALEPLLYDQAAFVDEVKRLILYHGDRVEPTLCRVLVADVTLIAQRRNRMLALSRTLSSRVLVRRTQGGAGERQDGFLVADNRHVLYLGRATAFRGELSLNVPHTARRLAQSFDEMWAQSTDDAELRRLHL